MNISELINLVSKETENYAMIRSGGNLGTAIQGSLQKEGLDKLGDDLFKGLSEIAGALNNIADSLKPQEVLSVYDPKKHCDCSVHCVCSGCSELRLER